MKECLFLFSKFRISERQEARDGRLSSFGDSICARSKDKLAEYCSGSSTLRLVGEVKLNRSLARLPVASSYAMLPTVHIFPCSVAIVVPRVSGGIYVSSFLIESAAKIKRVMQGSDVSTEERLDRKMLEGIRLRCAGEVEGDGADVQRNCRA